MTHDEQLVLGLLSASEPASLKNLKVTGIHMTQPSIMFDGLDSMLQPRRIYDEIHFIYGQPAFTAKVKEYARVEMTRQAQVAKGILLCPVLINSLENRTPITADEFLRGLTEHNSHKMTSGKATKGIYYIDNDIKNGQSLSFGDNDGAHWIRASDQFDPANADAHWIGEKGIIHIEQMPMIMRQAIEDSDYAGRPVRDLLDHPCLEGILIESVAITDRKLGGVTVTITPTQTSYMAAHRFVPVPHIVKDI